MSTTLERPVEDTEDAAQPVQDRDPKDVEDAALLAASGSLRSRHTPGLDGLTPPPGSRNRSVLPLVAALNTRWHDDAACSRVDAATSRRMVEARSQHEVADLAAAYCTSCPVRRACLTDARAIRAWGLAGGVVLIDGQRAADQRPGTEDDPLDVLGDHEGHHDDEVASQGSNQEDQDRLDVPDGSPADLDTLGVTAAQPHTPPLRVRRGQRWQPRRRTRRSRRSSAR